jgi:hypothetical protein
MGLQDSKAAATAIIAFENMMQNAEMQRQERKRKKGWIRAEVCMAVTPLLATICLGRIEIMKSEGCLWEVSWKLLL